MITIHSDSCKFVLMVTKYSDSCKHAGTYGYDMFINDVRVMNVLWCFQVNCTEF